MNSNELRKKYIGLQSKLLSAKDEISQIGDYGCLYLCLCSIAEEFNESQHNGYRVDIIADYIVCRSKGWIGSDFFVKDSVSILNYLTGEKWSRKIVESLPTEMLANTYTVEKWYNPNTKYTHFRRRWGDTLKNSNTVKNGILVGYYCYSYEYSTKN